MQRIRNTDRRLLTILLIVFVQMVGASMVIPILPRFAQSEFFLSSSVIGVLVSSFFVAQFVAGPWLGRLSDKYGRVPVLIVSQIGTALSFLMLGLAWAPWVLFASRILDGITGANLIVAQAYVTDVTPKGRRTEALGLILAAFGLGFILGPAIGGLLSAAFGPRAPFVMAAVAAGLLVVMTWRNLDESLSAERREANRTKGSISLNPRQVLSNVPLLLTLIIGFSGQFGIGLLQATWSLFGQDVVFAGYSPRFIDIGIGLLLSIVGLFQLLTQTLLLRRMLKRFGEATLVAFGTGIRSVGLFIWAIIPTPILTALGAATFAVGAGLMMPSLQALATETVEEDVRGGVLGLYQSAISLSTIISTAVGGWLYGIGPTLPYWLGASFSLITVFLAIPLFRIRLGKPEEAAV